MIKKYFCKNVPFLISSIVKNIIMINGQKGKLKKNLLKKIIAIAPNVSNPIFYCIYRVTQESWPPKIQTQYLGGFFDYQ